MTLGERARAPNFNDVEKRAEHTTSLKRSWDSKRRRSLNGLSHDLAPDFFSLLFENSQELVLEKS